MFPLGIVHSKWELWLVSKEQQGEEKKNKKGQKFQGNKRLFFSSTLSTKLTSFNVSWSLLCYFLPTQTKLEKTPIQLPCKPMIKFLPIWKSTSAYGYLHTCVTDPLTSIRLKYLIKIKDSFLNGDSCAWKQTLIFLKQAKA